MRGLFREYVAAVLVVAVVFGCIALALELPAIDAGVRWAAATLLDVASESRWTVIGITGLVLAGCLAAVNRRGGKAGGTGDDR